MNDLANDIIMQDYADDILIMISLKASYHFTNKCRTLCKEITDRSREYKLSFDSAKSKYTMINYVNKKNHSQLNFQSKQ